MINVRWFVCSVVLICGSIGIKAQTYRVESFSAQSGLISDHINDVAQAENGTLWITTPRGISNFDGLNFYNYKDTSDFLPISRNSKIYPVGDNQVIVIGHSALHFVGRHFKDSIWINLNFPDSVDVTARYWDVDHTDNEVRIKYISDNKLYTYSATDNTWTQSDLPRIIHNTINKIVFLDKMTLILTKTGIYTETSTGWSECSSSKSVLQKVGVSDIAFDQKSKAFFILTENNRIAKLHDGKLEYLDIKTKLRSPKFSELKMGNNGFLFFRTDKSFYWYHAETGAFKSFIPSDDDISAIGARLLVDRENGLWITSYRGLHHIPSFLFSGYAKANGISGAEVSVVHETDPGEYLIGYQTGYSILKNDSVILTKFFSSKNQVNTRLTHAAKNSTNTTYIAGGELGVGVLQPDYKINWIPLPGKSVDLVRFLSDTLWVVDNVGGLYYVNNDKLVYKVFVHAYPRNMIMQDGRLMIISRSGLRIINGTAVQHITNSHDLLFRQAYCAFTVGDQVFVGTEGGLGIIKNESIEKGSLNGIHLGRPIYAVIQKENEIWFGTDNGVYLLQDSALTHFGENSGLLGWEINRGAFIKDSQGRIVIGTNKGLNFYDPLHFEEKKLKFTPDIKWIKSQTRQYDSRPIRLSAEERSLSIGLQAVTFTGNPVEFRYRMIGFQEEWQVLTATENREILYRNLPTGSLQFEFQARLPNSEWSKSTFSPPITRAEPFFKSYTFFFLLLLLSGGAGYGIRWMLTNKKLRENLEKEIQDRVKDLKKSEAKLQLALENSKMGVWMYDIKNDHTEYSNEMFDIMDMAPFAEPVGFSNYLSRVHKDDHARVIEEVNEAVMNHKGYDLEVRVQLRDGTYRWLSIKGKAIYNTKGEPEFLSGTMNDISNRKMYQTMRENLISELEKTNQELDRFIYSVSHDLSAPIKSIQGLINLARMEPLSEDVAKYLSLIDRSITRQNDFIKEIVEYGRNVRLPVEIVPVNVANLINDIIEDLKYSEHFEGTEVVLNIDPDSAVIDCDKIRLKIILNNLLSNAFKYKNKNLEKHKVTITLEYKGEHFSLSIQDNGIGIEERHFENLFAMFYRATDQHPGSGIGLYIANEAAKKMGCTIEVSSRFGHGSTFTLKK